MKKLLLSFLIVVLTGIPLFATEEWNAGYLQGYADALAGKANQVEQKELDQENKDSTWEVLYYVDSFGDPTSEGYITQKNISKGTFSNTATRNSALSWRFLIDKRDVALKIYEYGKYVVTGYGNRSHKLSVKESDGSIHDFYCNSGSDRIFVQEPQKLVAILQKEGTIKLSVQDLNYSSSTYNLGTLDCTGLNKAFEDLFL